jgi:sulfoxide reductase heme-binding subunit YedZ
MARHPRWLKPLVAALIVLPIAWEAFAFFTDRLGANPIAEALNFLGKWTLILLLASLACTPLRIVTGWTWPLRIRRMLGLAAFEVGCAHFVFYAVVDQGLDWGEIWSDLSKRKFITVGFAALVAMVPLAVTSTKRMLQRLGARRWNRLHKLAYVAAVLAIVHFVWRVKSDVRQPIAFATVLAVLFAIRLFDWARRRAVVRARSSSAAR